MPWPCPTFGWGMWKVCKEDVEIESTKHRDLIPISATRNGNKANSQNAEFPKHCSLYLLAKLYQYLQSLHHIQQTHQPNFILNYNFCSPQYLYSQEIPNFPPFFLNILDFFSFFFFSLNFEL